MLTRRSLLAAGVGGTMPLLGEGGGPALAEEAPPALEAYAFWGNEAGSYLPNADFQEYFSSALKTKVEFDVADTGPTKANVIERLERRDIIYANVHGGFLNDVPLHVWRLNKQGDPKDPSWYISGQELYDWRADAGGGGRTIAPLVVIVGCSMTDPPPSDKIVPIPGALGIGKDDTRRAFIGFGDKVTGVALDRFFRVFFALWTTGFGEYYPSLEEAQAWTKRYIEEWFRKQGEEKDDDPERRDTSRRRHYMNRQDASYAQELQIIGHRRMRYSELLRASAARRGLKPPGSDPGPRPSTKKGVDEPTKKGVSENVGDLLSDQSKVPRKP